MKNDRITAGGIAGLIGGIVQEIYGVITKWLGLTNRDFLDFAKVLPFGKTTGGVLGNIAGVLSHLTFCIILGALFAYIIRKTSSNYLWFKAGVFGAGVWFWSLGIGTLFKLPVFEEVPPMDAITTFFGALVFSLVAALVLKIIDDRTKIV